MSMSVQSAAERAVVSSSIPRNGNLTVRALVDLYMLDYAGRDPAVGHRLTWWCTKIGDIALAELSDDHVYFALEDLAARAPRYWAGTDADGRPIMKAKKARMAPATINRYAATLGGMLTWAIKKRLAPKGFEHPCRKIERRPEDNERVRFLTDAERTALLAACKTSKWDRMYLLVLLGITTGARRGELLGLRGRDIDLARGVAYVETTKNGDRKVLPLLPAVVDEIRRFRFAPGALLFASRRRPDVGYHFEPVWQAALKAAGVRDFRFHDLRHTCASYLAQNGATLLEIADVLGHRQLAVTKRYSHLTTAHKARLVSRVLGDIR
jgi:integrase